MAHGAGRGFFRTAYDNLVAARMKQAQSYVNGSLLMLDDETLKAHGYSRAELARKGGIRYPF